MSLLARWIGMSPQISHGAGQAEPVAAKEEWWAQLEDKYFGMENFGNTCYANSVIQALYFCRPFRELVQLSGPIASTSGGHAHGGVSGSTSSWTNHSVSASTSQSTFIHPSHIDPSAAPASIPSSSSTSSVRPGVGRAVTSPAPPQGQNQKLVTGGGGGFGANRGGLGSRAGKGKEREGQARPMSSGGTSAGKSSFATMWGGSQRRSAANAAAAHKAAATTGPVTAGGGGNLAEGSPNGGAPAAETTAGASPARPRTSPAPAQGAGASSPAAPTAPKRNFGAADMSLDQPGVGAYDPTQRARQPTADSRTTFPLNPDSATTADTILSTLRDLFLTISHQPRQTGAIAPHAFITTLKRSNELFRTTQHQDAHEFFNYLINTVAEDVVAESTSSSLSPSPADPTTGKGKTLVMPRPGEPGRTWVHKLFEGVLTNETRCLTCETVSQRDEAFLDLSIDIEQNASVTACLKQFSASEMLTQKNKFSCDRCGALQEAEKRMKIKKLPNVLALHLKRFKYQEKLQRYMKLTYRVVFPFELRLFNTTDDIDNPDRMYELWAIVVHIGAGPHHGHYVTILKSGGRWVLFDDNTVTPIEESDIQKYYGDTPGVGSGYVLFYQAVDLDLTEVVRAAGLTPADVVDVAPSTNERHPNGVLVDGVADGKHLAPVSDTEVLSGSPERTASPSPSRKESVGDTSEHTSGSAGADPGGKPLQHMTTAPPAVGAAAKPRSPKPKRSLGLGLFSGSGREDKDGQMGGPDVSTRRASISQRRPSTAPPSPPNAALTELRSVPEGDSPATVDGQAVTSPVGLTSSSSRFFKRPFRRPGSISMTKAQAPKIEDGAAGPEPASAPMGRDQSAQSSSRASHTSTPAGAAGEDTSPTKSQPSLASSGGQGSSGSAAPAHSAAATPPPPPSAHLQPPPQPPPQLSPKQQKDAKKAAGKAAKAAAKEEVKREKAAKKEAKSRAKLEKAAARG